jgi:hypothetical protein
MFATMVSPRTGRLPPPTLAPISHENSLGRSGTIYPACQVLRSHFDAPDSGSSIWSICGVGFGPGDRVGTRRQPGTEVKVVTGIDDHSRFCVCARVVRRATARPVCEALSHALATHGSPIKF